MKNRSIEEQKEYERSKAYRESHKELYRQAQRKHYLANKEKILATKKEYESKHKDKMLAEWKKYRDGNRDKLRERDKQRWISNREIELERNKEYRQKNKDMLEERRIMRVHNVTAVQYRELFELHQGKCAICYREASERKKLCVDHCHVTGKVRGLLCRHCNTMIGMANDSLDILERAKEYIMKYK